MAPMVPGSRCYVNDRHVVQIANLYHLRYSGSMPSGYKRAESRLDSFRYAFAGLGHILRTQSNAWIHAGVTIGVVCAGLWLGVNRTEWAILVLTFGLVWMAESINTALEAVVDLASPEYHPLAKIGKDVAAAAVLVSALIAVIIGLLVLGPPLLSKFSALQSGF